MVPVEDIDWAGAVEEKKGSDADGQRCGAERADWPDLSGPLCVKCCDTNAFLARQKALRESELAEAHRLLARKDTARQESSAVLTKNSSAASAEWLHLSLSLFVRMSPTHESLGPFHSILRPSLLLFWPWREIELVAMLEGNASMTDDVRAKFEEA